MACAAHKSGERDDEARWERERDADEGTGCWEHTNGDTGRYV